MMLLQLTMRCWKAACFCLSLSRGLASLQNSGRCCYMSPQLIDTEQLRLLP